MMDGEHTPLPPILERLATAGELLRLSQREERLTMAGIRPPLAPNLKVQMTIPGELLPLTILPKVRAVTAGTLPLPLLMEMLLTMVGKRLPPSHPQEAPVMVGDPRLPSRQKQTTTMAGEYLHLSPLQGIPLMDGEIRLLSQIKEARAMDGALLQLPLMMKMTSGAMNHPLWQRTLPRARRLLTRHQRLPTMMDSESGKQAIDPEMDVEKEDPMADEKCFEPVIDVDMEDTVSSQLQISLSSSNKLQDAPVLETTSPPEEPEKSFSAPVHIAFLDKFAPSVPYSISPNAMKLDLPKSAPSTIETSNLPTSADFGNFIKKQTFINSVLDVLDDIVNDPYNLQSELNSMEFLEVERELGELAGHWMCELTGVMDLDLNPEVVAKLVAEPEPEQDEDGDIVMITRGMECFRWSPGRDSGYGSDEDGDKIMAYLR